MSGDKALPSEIDLYGYESLFNFWKIKTMTQDLSISVCGVVDIWLAFLAVCCLNSWLFKICKGVWLGSFLLSEVSDLATSMSISGFLYPTTPHQPESNQNLQVILACVKAEGCCKSLEINHGGWKEEKA